MNLTPQQQTFKSTVHSQNGNVLGIARAGTGKTTTIVSTALSLPGNQDVFLGAFNKRAAIDLQNRIKGHSNLTASTFHSAGLAAMYLSSRARPEVNGYKSLNLARQLWAGGRKIPKDKWPALAGWISLAKQSLITPESADESWVRLAEFYGIDGELGSADIQQLVKAAKRLLSESTENLQVIDFDDMLYLPFALKLDIEQFDMVFLDEAQDTNASRLWLARQMAINGQLNAVGDDKQAIYGFTGALTGALDDIRSRFGTIDCPLTVCFRCPRSVIREAQKYVPDIQAWESADEGIVREEAIEKINLQPGDTVLCRLNAPLISLAFQLLRERKPVQITGRDIGQGLARLIKTLCPNESAKLETLEIALNDYERTETSFLEHRQKYAQLYNLVDKCEAIHCLCSGLRADQQNSIGSLIALIAQLFNDESRAGAIILSTIHKAKGAEWPRVYWLQTPELKWIKQDWQIEQETNLKYVAITRAQKELIYVR